MRLLRRPARAVCDGLLRAGVALVFAAIAICLDGDTHPVAASGDLPKASRAVERLADSGRWPAAEARPVLDALERETRRFLAMPKGKTATSVGRELVPILERLHEGLSGRLENMRQEVLERDGDIEELMATGAYRDRETLALTALYHLSWARYQLSQLLPAKSPEREPLLRGAVRGFSEFVYVNEFPEIYGDCLYGRALTFYALGDRRKAIQDLEEAVNLGRRNRVYSRATSALKAVRSGAPIAPPAPVDRTTVEFDRLKLLLKSHAARKTASAGTRASGQAGKMTRKRAEGQVEALALARALAARGGASAERVKALVGDAGSPDTAFANFLLAELASDAGDHATARDHYAAAAAAKDPDAPEYRSRARLGAASASYRAGEYARAAQAFSDFLSEDPEEDGEAEAALYFRFKATEASLAERAPQGGKPEGSADNRETLVDELRAYLDRFPEGDHAAEVRYRLGEALHTLGDCAGALGTIGKPKGNDTWSLWSRFIIVQCQADATRASWSTGDTDPPASYRASLETAREITTAVSTTTDTTLERLGAKSSLVVGLLAATAPKPQPEDVVEFLGDFERRFPHAGDLAGDAIALRAIARALLGDADEARADIDRLWKLEDAAAARQRHVRRVGSAIMREAERSSEPDRRRSLLSVAKRAYEALVESAGSGLDGKKTTGEAGDPAPAAADLTILGQVALELRDLDRAAFAYGRLLELDPDSLEARRGMALTAEAQGQEQAALEHWRGILSRTAPGETLWYEATLRAARMQDRLGQAAQACSALREARTTSGLPTAEELASALSELERQLCP